MEKRKNNIVPILIVGVLLGGVAVLFKRSDSGGRQTTKTVMVPQLSVAGQQGEKLFNANCAECHGKNAGGTNKGPTFLHRVYHPNHHADGAFVIAAKRGTTAHHWKFGNMPPIKRVSDEEVKKIIGYVREMQKANGIF